MVFVLPFKGLWQRLLVAPGFLHWGASFLVLSVVAKGSQLLPSQGITHTQAHTSLFKKSQAYAISRNWYLAGGRVKLSPFISRGTNSVFFMLQREVP